MRKHDRFGECGSCLYFPWQYFDNASILIFILNYSTFCPLKYFENVFIENYCLQVIDVAHGPLVFLHVIGGGGGVCLSFTVKPTHSYFLKTLRT